MFGTPGYMAPEQIRGERVDGRADLFGLGCVLYRLSSGRAPFANDNLFALLKQVCEQLPPPLQEVPELLSTIIDRLLAKEPKDRFQTASEVAAVLARCHELERKGEPMPKLPRQQPRRPCARRALAVGAGIVALVVVGLALWRYMGDRAVSDRPVGGNSDAKAVLAPKQAAVPPVAMPQQKTPLRALIVLPSKNFYYPEYLPVRSRLMDRRVEVVVASSTLEASTPESRRFGPPVPPDLLLSEVKVEDYRLICFCGGEGGAEEYSGNGPYAEQARQLIHRALAADRYVAALSVTPVILADAGILKGVSATCYRFGNPEGIYIHRLKKTGALWVDEPVVLAGRIITGRSPKADDVDAFCDVLFKCMTERSAVSVSPPAQP